MISLDPTTGRAKFGDVTADLTRREAQLLAFLLRANSTPCNSEELLQKVWGYVPHTGSPGLMRVHIHNIRKKLGYNSILTKFGWGYYVE